MQNTSFWGILGAVLLFKKNFNISKLICFKSGVKIKNLYLFKLLLAKLK